MAKKHWIRKHYINDWPRNKKILVYDYYAACGVIGLLTGTIFKDKVTCKTCKRIMKGK